MKADWPAVIGVRMRAMLMLLLAVTLLVHAAPAQATAGGVDLSVTITDGQTTYDPGGVLNYTVVVTNNGPGDAIGTTVSDSRPTRIGFWTWTCDPATPAAYQCSSDITNPAAFSDTLDLPAFGSVTYHVTASVIAPVSGDLSNIVQVMAPAAMPELNPADNTATDVDTLATTTLTITKTVSPSPVLTGGVLTYFVQVTDSGAASATSVTVTDTLPAGVTYISSFGFEWSCGASAGVVTCSVPLMRPGATPPISISVQAPATPVILNNTATVSAGNAPLASASVQTQVSLSLPALNEWGLLALGVMLASIAVWQFSRRV
jgi:uncharacterized repeat protein (TIGR01451 family)